MGGEKDDRLTSDTIKYLYYDRRNNDIQYIYECKQSLPSFCYFSGSATNLCYCFKILPFHWCLYLYSVNIMAVSWNGLLNNTISRGFFCYILFYCLVLYCFIT